MACLPQRLKNPWVQQFRAEHCQFLLEISGNGAVSGPSLIAAL